MYLFSLRLPLRLCAFARDVLFLFRERAYVIHHMPTLFLGGHLLLTSRHYPGYSFRDLPEEFSIRHRCHAFFVREVGRFTAQLCEVCFVAGTRLAVTKDTVTFRSFEIELFPFRDRLRTCGHRILSLIGVRRNFPRVL